MLVKVLPLDGEIWLVSHQHDRDGAQVTLHVQQLVIHKLDHLETVAENNIFKYNHLEWPTFSQYFFEQYYFDWGI